MTILTSGMERFTVDDMDALTDAVAAVWTDAAELDWSVPAGTLEWSCLATADHAVDCVFAPAFFLASRQTDDYPVAGADMTLGARATPALLVSTLRLATRLLVAIVRDTDPAVRAIIANASTPVLGAPGDFLPRAALELILHAHDVCSGLGVPFEPPSDLTHRLREHTRPWPAWTPGWPELGRSDDPWHDLLTATGRARRDLNARDAARR